MLKIQVVLSDWPIKVPISIGVIILLVFTAVLNYNFGAETVDQQPGVQRGIDITYPDELSSNLQLLISVVEVVGIFILFEFGVRRRSRLIKLIALAITVISAYDVYANALRLWMANSLPSEAIDVTYGVFSGIRPPDVIYEDNMGQKLRKLNDGTFVYSRPEVVELANDDGSTTIELQYKALASDQIAYEKVPTFFEGLNHFAQRGFSFAFSTFLAFTIGLVPELCFSFLLVLWLSMYLIDTPTPLTQDEIGTLLQTSLRGSKRSNAIKTILSLRDRPLQEDLIATLNGETDGESVRLISVTLFQDECDRHQILGEGRDIISRILRNEVAK